MSNFPTIGVARVQSVSASPWGIYVMHPSLQSSGILVRPLLNGSADALRVSQKALPTVGTWGLVAWPYNDLRNGIWLGSIYTQNNTALLTSSTDVDYEAHPSGAWTLLDQNGNFTFSFPDGSALQVGSTGGAPALSRNVVNPDQTTTQVVYTNAQRVAATPATFPVEYTSASGTSFNIDTSGNVTVNLAVGATMNYTQGGSAAEHLTIAELLVTQFNNHTHTSASPGSQTSTPHVQITASQIETTLVKVQS